MILDGRPGDHIKGFDLLNFKTHETMISLTSYQRDIIEVTGCRPEDAEEIEDYMRNAIFHSTLDWQSRRQFNRAARMAYRDIMFIHSPEGQAYMRQITKSYVSELDTDCMGNCFSDADPGL